MNSSRKIEVLIGVVLVVSGLFMMMRPDRTMEAILDLAMAFCFINGAYLIISYMRSRQLSDLLLALMAFAFLIVLSRHNYIPQWLVRVTFGGYCVASSLVNLIQLFIDIANEVPERIFTNTFLSVSYFALALVLLFFYPLGQDLLLQLFGVYFIILGIRFLMNALLLHGAKSYSWKGGFRITLPPVISAMLPEWFIQRIDHSLQAGQPIELEASKTVEDPRLRVMVHVGPEGFQKIGHITFAYDDLVYSYGNYDQDSFHLNGTIGDGVFFNADREAYIANVVKFEHNSIFEYGIRLDEQQRSLVETELRKLADRSFRWYTRIEREDGYDRFSLYEWDYPSRLHYRTGAKMYKIKNGKFRTYWALGDNCAAFVNVVLHQLGADALSLRGITSPGTYLDFLQTEYERPGSPVITRRTYTESV